MTEQADSPSRPMSARQQQILQATVEHIATQGYAALTMRAVARISGMTLGALQYHFPSRAHLLTGLAGYVATQYRQTVEQQLVEAGPGLAKLHAGLDVFLDAPVDDLLMTDRLFPQLWAMALVEPTMAELLDAIYVEYLSFIETCLQEHGVGTPRPDALAIMAMLEGVGLFIGRGCRWQEDGPATVEAMRAFLDARYGQGSAS